MQEKEWILINGVCISNIYFFGAINVFNLYYKDNNFRENSYLIKNIFILNISNSNLFILCVHSVNTIYMKNVKFIKMKDLNKEVIQISKIYGYIFI